jgi:beta-glucosidase/6-phospho-beta-glucosidase/beta-galactosidase
LHVYWLTTTADFVAVDYYFSYVVSPAVSNVSACATNNSTSNFLYPLCVSTSFSTKFNWELGPYTSYVGLSTPTYMREGLSYLYSRYGKPIMISEFGTTDYNEPDQPFPAMYFDQYRSDYYVSYLNEILKAIWEDGVDVIGTLAWSFADNWEWGTYAHKLGMQAVPDRSTQERVYKRSMFDYADFYQARGGRR